METDGTRIKNLRRMIVSSTLEKLKNYERKGIDQTKKKYIFDYLEETEESNEESPIKKERKYNVTQLKKKFFYWFETPFERKIFTFTKKNPAPKFSSQGKGAAENISSAIEAWSLLFSDDLLNFILKYTNQIIEYKLGTSNDKDRSSRFRALDMLELKAFIGLLYYAGLKKKKKCFFI